MPYLFTTYEGNVLDLPGAASAIAPNSAATPSIVRHHYGTFGESEIRSFVAGRTLVGDIWMFSYEFNLPAAVYARIKDMHVFLNSHGVLEELDANGVVRQTFEHVTFKGYSIANGPDGHPMGPMKDIGKCLVKGFATYWIHLTNLTWYQSLTVDEDQRERMREI